MTKHSPHSHSDSTQSNHVLKPEWRKAVTLIVDRSSKCSLLEFDANSKPEVHLYQRLSPGICSIPIEPQPTVTKCTHPSLTGRPRSVQVDNPTSGCLIHLGLTTGHPTRPQFCQTRRHRSNSALKLQKPLSMRHLPYPVNQEPCFSVERWLVA